MKPWPRCACCRPICAIRLFATSPSCAKKQEADRQKGKKSWQAERYARGNLRKIFERLERTDHRWLTQGYRSLAGRERLDDLLYLPQLNKHQIQTLATMTAAMFQQHLRKTLRWLWRDRWRTDHGCNAEGVSDAGPHGVTPARHASTL